MPIDIDARRKIDKLTKLVSELQKTLSDIREDLRKAGVPQDSKKLPEFIAKRILPDRTLAGGIEADANTQLYVESAIDDEEFEEGTKFAIYKLVKEYNV